MGCAVCPVLIEFLTLPCRWYEQNWRQDDNFVMSGPSFQFEFSLVSNQFPICTCSVSNTLRVTENLQIENWDKTKLSCLEPVVFTPPTWTRQSCVVCVGGVNKLLMSLKCVCLCVFSSGVHSTDQRASWPQC